METITAARILVVEDEAISAELMREWLVAMGHEVCSVVASGEDAVRQALEKVPDLIFMDIKLRGVMTGVQAAEKIQQSLDVPIIYVTAYADAQTLGEATLTKPYGYIQKPYRWNELNSGIKVALYRHRMERMLREREQSYRALADNLPGILYRHSLLEKNTQFFNSMLETVTGYPPAEIPASEVCPIESLIVPEDCKKVVAAIREAAAAGAPYCVEYRITARNREIRHVTEYGRPIPARDGVPVQIDGMIFDVTERKRVEAELETAYQALEERKTFFESIISHNESGILVTDLKMRILLANPYVARLLEKREADLVGKRLGEYWPELDANLVAGIDAGEFTFSTPDKQLVIGYNRFNLKGTHRAVVGHIINCKDLSEVIRIRAEMRQKERLSTMGEVVARVAHEMRNPLFGMTAVGQILDMELDLSPAHKVLLNSFLKEARRLNNLVEELLDCTRELRLKKKRMDLVKILAHSTQLNEALAAERRVRINTSLCSDQLFVVADPEKIEQVILNILQNAIEASDPGGEIAVVMERDADSVSIRIADRGHGIPEDLLEKIFDVFYTTKKNGTGMGLSISKSIAEAHGGRLSALNNDGGGASFILMLPLKGSEA